jgi:hypothetical protein
MSKYRSPPSRYLHIVRVLKKTALQVHKTKPYQLQIKTIIIEHHQFTTVYKYLYSLTNGMYNFTIKSFI